MFKLNWIIPPQFEPIQFTYERHYDVQLPQTVRFQPGAKLNAAFNRKIKLLFKDQKAEELKVMQWSKCITYIFALLCIWFLRNKYTTKVTVQTALLFLAMGNPFQFISMEVKHYAVRVDCGIVALWLWAVMGDNLSLSLFFVASCVTFISKTTKSNAIVKKKL